MLREKFQQLALVFRVQVALQLVALRFQHDDALRPPLTVHGENEVRIDAPAPPSLQAIAFFERRVEIHKMGRLTPIAKCPIMRTNSQGIRSMATKTILLQGVTSDNHLTAVRQVLGIPNPERVIISTAFVNEGGLSALSNALKPVATKTMILAGIRNGITSAQGLRKSLSLGCTTYAVDTGSRTVIFHPKIYFSRNDNEARLIVGSANLTIGGLNSNIEASLFLTLELEDPDSAALVADLEGKINSMIDEYSEHIFLVRDDAQIQQLLESGRIIDESIVPAPIPSGSSRNPALDSIPQMKLKIQQIARPRIEQLPTMVADGGATPRNPALVGVAAPMRKMVWESSPLSRRHLTIPRGPKTHATGSMLFTKGALRDIDQRHYFRDEVFANLEWHFDTTPGRTHMERAEARFQLIIRNIDYGVFTLRLSHNSRTDTRSYKQRNSMTQLHWGEARPFIAREDLLGRTMYLYRDEVDDGLFVIEID